MALPERVRVPAPVFVRPPEPFRVAETRALPVALLAA